MLKPKQTHLHKVVELSVVVPNEHDQEDPPPLKVKKDKKVHLDLSPVHVGYLEHIARWTGAKTFSEVIRTSLKLYYFILKETGGEGEIYVRTKDGESKMLF